MRSNRNFSVGIGVVVIAVLAGQALGASSLAYTLILGGNNDDAQWKASNLPPYPPRPLYTGGNAADGQSLYKGNLINYAVVLQASGIQAAGVGAGYPIYGAANVVFDLELRVGSEAGALATGAIFRSTINNGTGTDPTAAAAFACSYQLAGGRGRLIDTFDFGGPRMEPIYTYPFYAPASGKLIGMGSGYKEWNKGAWDVRTSAGIGMVMMPDSTAGLGVVPVAEGQIDMSALPNGTYVLKVVPGAGNNVLRGDLVPNLNAAQNRPAFATAVDAGGATGDTITFDNSAPMPCTPGIAGRYVYYNNSKWDNYTPGIDPGDFAAIAPDKQALLPNNTSSFANYISYSKTINGIMIDVCHIAQAPIPDVDIAFVMGSSTAQGDPVLNWTEVPAYPIDMQVYPGQGVGGSDRLVMIWADNAIPNTKWLLVYLFANSGAFEIPQDDCFIFGVAIGDGNGDALVNATDQSGVRTNPHTSLNLAPLNDVWDMNRDRLVNATDQAIVRANPATSLNKLKMLNWIRE